MLSRKNGYKLELKACRNSKAKFVFYCVHEPELFKLSLL